MPKIKKKSLELGGVAMKFSASLHYLKDKNWLFENLIYVSITCSTKRVRWRSQYGILNRRKFKI